MKHVYANLLGEWCNLNEDETSLVFDTDPTTWRQESLGDLFKYDYVNISYKGNEYRIHPTMIQIVTKDAY